MDSSGTPDRLHCKWTVHSCSSEAQVHAAANVIKEELYRIWQTREPADEAWLILEARPPVAFNKIEIVNAGSALVEVFGLRVDSEGEDMDDYEMLLSAQQLMTVKDLVSKSNRNRAFTYDVTHKLAPQAAQQRWSRIRVLCRQPFGTEDHKACIGLSRLHFNPCRTMEEMAADAAEARLKEDMKTGLAELFPNATSHHDHGIFSQVTEPKRLTTPSKVEQDYEPNTLVIDSASPVSTPSKKRRLPVWCSSSNEQKQLNNDTGRKGLSSDHEATSSKEKAEIEDSLLNRTTKSASVGRSGEHGGTGVSQGVQKRKGSRGSEGNVCLERSDHDHQRKKALGGNNKSKLDKPEVESQKGGRQLTSIDGGTSSRLDSTGQAAASRSSFGGHVNRMSQSRENMGEQLPSDSYQDENRNHKGHGKGQSSQGGMNSQVDKGEDNNRNYKGRGKGQSSQGGMRFQAEKDDEEENDLESTCIDAGASARLDSKGKDVASRRSSGGHVNRMPQSRETMEEKIPSDSYQDKNRNHKGYGKGQSSQGGINSQAEKGEDNNRNRKGRGKGQSSQGGMSSQVAKADEDEIGLDAQIVSRSGQRNEEPSTKSQMKIIQRSLEDVGDLTELKHADQTTKPFSRFLDGVVFAISGIVNPERADLRDKAVEMGAQYRPDWTSDCTLLVCAFANTPKFRQVKGENGTIVSKDWILECHQRSELVEIDTYLMHVGKPWRQIGVSYAADSDGYAPQENISSISSLEHDKQNQEVPSKKYTTKDARKTLASLSKVQKWAYEDLTSTIAWLQQQENQPEVEELKTTASQGIVLCLQDTIECLKTKKRIKSILETWAFVPQAVKELADSEEGGDNVKKLSREDLLHEAERMKWIYEDEFKQIKEQSDSAKDKGKQLDEDDDGATELMSNDGSADTRDWESDGTEILDEESIREAQESITRKFRGH